MPHVTVGHFFWSFVMNNILNITKAIYAKRVKDAQAEIDFYAKDNSLHVDTDAVKKLMGWIDVLDRNSRYISIIENLDRQQK
jgi:hypothetical protein